MKGQIQSVEVTYLVHATEDLQRVEEAVGSVLGASGPPEVTELEGHFGNKILRVRHHLTGGEAETVFANLRDGLARSSKAELKEELHSSVDEHSSLFLRFDKQKLLAGRLVIGGPDPVRVKVKPRLFTMRGDAASFFTEALDLEA